VDLQPRVHPGQCQLPSPVLSSEAVETQNCTQPLEF